MRDRMQWHTRFLDMAKLVASWSKDPSTQAGAVIVRKDSTICSTGYNGFPQRMGDDPLLYADREKKYSRIVHAEMNALLFARERVTGYWLYTYPFSCCERCAVHMIQAGIDRFIFPEIPDDKKERWGESFAKTKAYLHECGLRYTAIPMA